MDIKDLCVVDKGELLLTHKAAAARSDAMMLFTIRRLLTGNDVRCFTTDQYADKYLSHRSALPHMRANLKYGWPRMHLQFVEHVSGAIREVKTDVWAEAEDGAIKWRIDLGMNDPLFAHFWSAL